MKAVAKLRPEAGAMAVIDLPTPEPGLGEALVQIQAGGICGTDVAIWHWHTAVVGQYAPTFPLIVGHEFSGKLLSQVKVVALRLARSSRSILRLPVDTATIVAWVGPRCATTAN
jgi:D-arabinose 1-dehydrogenase-like Zn-dependent alcohol dehydrogenase